MNLDSTMTIGVDISDKKSDVCILGEDGKVLKRLSIQSKPSAFRKFFEEQPEVRIIIEASTHSPWMADLLESLGHEVIVANSAKVAMIAKSQCKSDSIDAEILARYGRIDVELLSPIKHRSKSTRLDLLHTRTRAHFVEERTAFINHVRGLVKAQGHRVRKCTPNAFPAWARKELPADMLRFVEPSLVLIEQLNTQIALMDEEIKALSIKYPETQKLMAITGVGPVTSTTFVLTLEDPKRFRKGRQVAAYLGLVPRRRQSGDRNPQLGITKSGDKYLRSLLVQCAQYILGPFGEDSDLRRWGLKLAGQGKNTKRRAIVAVARRLAVLMYRLWKTEDAYVPLYAETRAAAA